MQTTDAHEFLIAGTLAGLLLAGVGAANLLIPAIGRRLARLVPPARVGWGLVAAAGVAVVAGATGWYDRAAAAADDRQWLAAVGNPLLAADPFGFAATDRGTPVPLCRPAEGRSAVEVAAAADLALDGLRHADSVIRRGPAADAANCHGWVFAAGRAVVHGSDVDVILADNAYAPAADPRPGDLVVYRTPAGAVAHTAVVRAVLDDGTVLVEGKWGWLGVYLHPVGGSPYGTHFTYHRSPRPGHTLAGGDLTPPGAAGHPAPAG